MEVKTALNLVGGGSKGIVTCGALKYICEKKIKYDAVFATSSGSLNAAVLAAGDLDLLEHMWMTITNKDVRKMKPWRLLSNDGALYDSTPLLKTLRKYVDLDKIRTNPIPHSITLTDISIPATFHVLLNGEHHIENVCEYLLASCSIPLLFPPVRGHLYDGGVMDDYNAGHALSLWYERCIVVHPSVPTPFVIKGYQEALNALITCSGWASWLAQKERFLRNSQNLIELIPSEPLRLGVLDFDYKGLDRKSLINSGYEMAKRVFEGG